MQYGGLCVLTSTSYHTLLHNLWCSVLISSLSSGYLHDPFGTQDTEHWNVCFLKMPNFSHLLLGIYYSHTFVPFLCNKVVNHGNWSWQLIHSFSWSSWQCCNTMSMLQACTLAARMSVIQRSEMGPYMCVWGLMCHVILKFSAPNNCI